jgi:predicted component of type VI protein secretion system
MSSSASGTIPTVFRPFVLALVQPPINVHVAGEQWWVTASVAVGAALLGSFAGAAGLYYASAALEGRRRKALSEIRRKAKVYTPIREELVALQRAIAENRHLGYRGILRERPDYQTLRPAPVLAIWRELVEDGRANTMASPRVRAVLDRVDECADALNGVCGTAQATFKERGDAISQESGFSPAVTNWHSSEFETLFRHGVRGSSVFADPFTRGPKAPAPTTLTAEQDGFVQRWEADEAVRNATQQLEQAEQALAAAITAAIQELDAAMKRIADKYEHEPD